MKRKTKREQTILYPFQKVRYATVDVTVNLPNVEVDESYSFPFTTQDPGRMVKVVCDMVMLKYPKMTSMVITFAR
jgi:hypothetical protein